MDLFSKLPQCDKELMIKYIGEYANTVIDQQCLEHYLRFWNKNKQPFFKAFGEKFIIRKEVSVNKTRRIMINEFSTLIQNNTFLRNFAYQYQKSCKEYSKLVPDIDINRDYWLRYLMFDYDSLIDNKYCNPTFQLEPLMDKSKKSITISTGMKAIKALGKAVRHLGADIIADYCPVCGLHYSPSLNREKCLCSAKLEKSVSAFEKFRLLHSQILNQKTITGTLCLSIHPLDFMTMSDNECGWKSCMSWKDDGDYRLGTVEMMNSPSVVVAYLESSENMKLFEGYEWNSKKWRQLYIVNEDFIIGNRHYPYHSDDLENFVFEELYNVLNDTKDFGPYKKEFVEIDNECDNNIFNRKVYIEFYTNYMYNDLGNDTRRAYVSENFIESDAPSYCHNYSGEAVCADCGCIIEVESCPSNSLVCFDCSNMWVCEHCGTWCYSDEEQYMIDDLKICHSCFESYTTTCSITGTRIMKNMDNRYYISFGELSSDLSDYYSRRYCIYIDQDFKRLHPETLLEMFGEIKTGKYNIKFIELSNCSQEGIQIISNKYNLKPEILSKLAEEKDEAKKIEMINEDLLY